MKRVGDPVEMDLRKRMIVHFGDVTLRVFFTSQDDPNDIVKKILRSLKLPVETRCGVSFMNERGYVIKMSPNLPHQTQLMMLYSPVFIREDEKEEIEKSPYQSQQLWLLLNIHSEIPIEVLYLIADYLRQLIKREYYCWDVSNALEMRGIDTLGTSIETSSIVWPFAATTITGLSAKNQCLSWRVQFDGVALHDVGYLRVGVLYSDEVGLLELHPPISTLPLIARESRNRVYDVIVQDGLLIILEVPGRILFKGRLNPNRQPSPECPLLLAVWSKISMRVTITRVSHQRIELTKDQASFPLSVFNYRTC